MELVFDIGATHARLALVNGGQLEGVARMDTDASAAGFAKFLGAVQTLVGDRRLRAIAGGLPVQTDSEGVVTFATNLPHWLGLPVRDQLRRLFDCPVYLQNDVIMGGLGEAHAGAGITEGVMAYYTISTGVNAVRIVNGRVDESIRRYELGQQLLLDAAGEPVTLESLAGGAALEARYGRKPGRIRDADTWRVEERQVAIGLYNTALHWTPELIVLGGKMMDDIDMAVLRRELNEFPSVLPQVPKLVRAKLGDEMGLHGAMAYLRAQRRA